MTHYPQPNYYAPPPEHPQHKGASGFGIAAVIIGIIALLVAWVPFCGMAAIPLAAIGLILASVGLIVSLSGGRSTVGMSVAGGVVCLIAIIVPVVVTGASVAFFGAAAEQAAQEAARQQAELEARLATQPATAPAAVDPADLLQAFQQQAYADSATPADDHYKGRLVELTGTIAGTGTDPTGRRYITFAPDPAAGRVQCFFARDKAAKASALRQGQSVTIRGRCEGTSGYHTVVVRDCEVVE